MLPSDIRIFNTCIAPVRDADDTSGLPLVFHATGSSTGKLYSYRFCRNPYVDPTKRLYCSHFFYNFDLALFDQCLQQFVGTHDFVSFANKVEKTRGQYKGHGIELNTIKTVDKIDLIDEGNGYYVVNLRVQSALNRMLRNIVGASLHVAEGNMSLAELQDLLLTAPGRDYNPARPAPPEGLTLEHVYYENY
jgi:tRNA pseudouridine38-40 synthase